MNMDKIQNFKQQCDRCGHPNRVATTQCFDCAKEQPGNDGSQGKPKPYKICMACDKIIHEISYKQNHQRAPYVPPIHRVANHVTTASAEIHQMIRRSSSRRSNMSTQEITPSDTYTPNMLSEFLTNETSQIKEQFMSGRKHYNAYSEFNILNQNHINSGSVASLDQRSTPKLGMGMQHDTERSGHFGQDPNQVSSKQFEIIGFRDRSNSKGKKEPILEQIYGNLNNDTSKETLSKQGSTQRSGHFGQENKISQKQFEILGYRQSSSSIGQNEPILEQLLPNKNSKDGLSKESSSKANFHQISTSRGETIKSLPSHQKLQIDRSSSRENFNSQNVNTYESNSQILSYLNKQVHKADNQSVEPDSFRFKGHQHNQLKVIDKTLNSSNIEGFSNYNESIQGTSHHQMSIKEHPVAQYLPVQMKSFDHVKEQRLDQNINTKQSPFQTKQVLPDEHFRESHNSSKSSNQRFIKITNDQVFSIPAQMQRSTSREQFNARASIDQRQKTSHTPNVKDHESSEGQQSYFQTLNFEDNKSQNVSRPQQHEMQVQTDTFLAQSQPFYPTGFDQDPLLTMNLREQLQHQNALISDLRKENAELKYLLDRETEAKKKQHDKYQEFEGGVREQIKQLEFSVKHYQKMIEEIMKKNSEEMKLQNRQYTEEKREIMAEHEAFVDKMKTQHQLISETQKEYLRTLEGDNQFKDKQITQLSKENETLKKDIAFVNDISERRLDKQVDMDQTIEVALQGKIVKLESKNVELQKECYAINEENQVMERENIKLREAHSKMKEKQFNLSKMVYGKGVKASTPVAGAAPKVHKKISPFLEGPAKVHKKLTNIPMHKSRSFRSSSGVKSTFHRKYSASPLNY